MILSITCGPNQSELHFGGVMFSVGTIGSPVFAPNLRNKRLKAANSVSTCCFSTIFPGTQEKPDRMLWFWPSSSTCHTSRSQVSQTSTTSKLEHGELRNRKKNPNEEPSDAVDGCEIHFAPRNEAMVETVPFVGIYVESTQKPGFLRCEMDFAATVLAFRNSARVNRGNGHRQPENPGAGFQEGMGLVGAKYSLVQGQGQPFNLLVSLVWSIFSQGSKRVDLLSGPLGKWSKPMVPFWGLF